MGAKKKSLANKLARMTDEERARYLQRKADIEEEAKRRKEQLISTFMKNKIKREDGFSRLNLAKINQNWHQILRFNKCKEMKEDVEHMKKAIERVLQYKNRTIEKLLEELSMAEDQYSHNFQTHMSHIDKTLDDQNNYLKSMETKFEQELQESLESYKKEEREISENSQKEQKYLKMMIFGLEANSRKRSIEDKERYLQKKEEITSVFRTQFDAFVKRRERINAAIWRQIATIVKSHVHQTDMRRLHLAELKRLDAESAAEIKANQDRITLQEEEIKSLSKKFENLTRNSEETIKSLTKNVEGVNKEFLGLKRRFRKEQEQDEKKIVILTNHSNDVLRFLEKLHTKGEQLLSLSRTCAKFETEKEQRSKWSSIVAIEEEFLAEEDDKQQATKSRDSSAAKEVVKKIVISEKSPPATPQPDESVQRIVKMFDYMLELDNFWKIFRQAESNFHEIKNEKLLLEKENKQLRGMLRAFLEAAVLAQSIPSSSKVSTRAPSKSTGSRSAPLKRIII